MHRHCEYCMHKDNRDYKNVEQRRDKGCCYAGEFRGVQGGRAQEQICTVEEYFIERIWNIEHKRQKNRKCKGCAEDTDADRVE